MSVAPQISPFFGSPIAFHDFLNSFDMCTPPNEDVYPPRSEREEENQWEKAQNKEKQLTEQKRAARLHEQFCNVVRDFLEAEGKILEARHTNRLIQKAADLAADYLTHPYIKLPDNLVSARLKALYGVQDILQEVAGEIIGKMMWQSKSSDFELTKKWRKSLRELLIPD